MSSTHSIWAYLVSKQGFVGAVCNRYNAIVLLYAPVLLPINENVVTDSTTVLWANSDNSEAERIVLL
jgi:hypothetical protein